jgi:hypothetical protein
MVPIPVYKFPVLTTSLAIYQGNAFQIPATALGQVEECDGTSLQGAPGTGIPIAALTGGGLCGFAIGASTTAPPFPTAGGAASGGLIMTTPASVTDNDVPENEMVLLALAMPHVIFYGHIADSSGGNEIDYTATDRNDLLKLYALSVELTGSTNTVFLDATLRSGGTTTNSIARPLNWAYPQGVPVARSTSANADPWKQTGTGDTNPAVEFNIPRGTVWNVHL